MTLQLASIMADKQVVLDKNICMDVYQVEGTVEFLMKHEYIFLLCQ